MDVEQSFSVVCPANETKIRTRTIESLSLCPLRLSKIAMKPSIESPAAHEDKQEMFLVATAKIVEDIEKTDGYPVVAEAISSSIERDAHFDTPRDVLKEFDYDQKAFHRFWVWFNYTRKLVNFVSIALLTAQLVCLFRARIFLLTLWLVSCGSMHCSEQDAIIPYCYA